MVLRLASLRRSLSKGVIVSHGTGDRLPALARELAALQVAAIVTSNPYATRAAREASNTVPIIVALDYETDPVASGWITSIARPGGNLTGIFLEQPEMSGKLLQLLKEGVPTLTKVAVLWDEAIGRDQLEATEGAARAVGLTLKPLGVGRAQDLSGAFGTAARERATGLVVLTSPLLSLNRARISELALKHRLRESLRSRSWFSSRWTSSSLVGGDAVQAARDATTAIPIVMMSGGDPVARGWVGSLSRPGGNITGVTVVAETVLAGKRLELLREAVPGAVRIAVLAHGHHTGVGPQLKEAQKAAASLRVKLSRCRGSWHRL